MFISIKEQARLAQNQVQKDQALVEVFILQQEVDLMVFKQLLLRVDQYLQTMISFILLIFEETLLDSRLVLFMD
jgi:hypothetical protein